MKRRLRGALARGALLGILFGAAEGAAALALGLERWGHGVLATLGAWCAAALVYALLFAGAAALFSALGLSAARSAALVLAGGLFVELYWWTRPWLFPGRSALSAERLLASAGLFVLAAALAAAAARWPPRIAPPLLRMGAFAAGTVALAGGVALALDAWRGDERGRIRDANRDLPNLVLVIVDALRADVLEPYGGDRVHTPNVTRLARRGVVLEAAQAQAPVTWPSFGSILTGKYPLRHGLLYMRPGATLRDSLTLPALLKSARRTDGRRLGPNDWATAAFMTGTLTRGSRLLQGFDHVSELLGGNDLIDVESAWSWLRSDLSLFRVANKLRQRIGGDWVVRTALDWIERHRERRFAVLIHLYATHTPYDPDARFREAYLDAGYDGRIPAFYPHHRRAVQSGELVLRPEDVRQIRGLYEASVAEVDAQIGQVLDALDLFGLAEDTLVLVTADHGEELGDHGLWEHNWMYQTNLHVPWVMAWPEGLPAGLRVPELVETIDIFPTLCELLGLEQPAAPTEYDRIDGRSLVPLLNADASRGAEPRPAFSVNPFFASVNDGEWKLILPLAELEEETPAGGRLFHLSSDAGEEHDLSRDSEPRLREHQCRLTGLLRAWRASQPVPKEDLRPSVRDYDDLGILRSLGYVEDE